MVLKSETVYRAKMANPNTSATAAGMTERRNQVIRLRQD
jgi:hypothetical protein